MRGCANCCAAICRITAFASPLAADAAEARASLASFAFDLIVLDVMMPGESGLDLTRCAAHRAESAAGSGAAADRDGRTRGPRQRARTGRRRLSRQAVRAARTGAAHPQHPASAGPAADGGAAAALRFGGFRFDLGARRAVSRRRSVHLTAAEAGLLAEPGGARRRAGVARGAVAIGRSSAAISAMSMCR